MKIKQFEDKGLAHFSYAVLSETENKIILIDPARDPKQYYDYADHMGSKIIGIIETHPHADFVSAHLEIHKESDATIYVSKLVGAEYPHQAFDEGQEIKVGELKLRALNTPGHSPDSISIVASEDGIDKAVFTGDTLFIGDVGRPDLREKAGNMRAKREELARQMYRSTRDKLMTLDDDVTVYPAHGSGSLCGKALSNASSSTIKAEKMSNYALQEMTEEEFINELLSDQPFIPKYFPYDVDLNKQGAPNFQESIDDVRILEENFKPEEGAIIIDSRDQSRFKESHYHGAINIQEGDSFETWLGSIVGPNEAFYLIAKDQDTLSMVVEKSAKIGYEVNIKGAFIYSRTEDESSPTLNLEEFKNHPENYQIIDIRNGSELEEGKIFDTASHFPLHELREHVDEINHNKPVVVHCAAGYRSAAGASILDAAFEDQEVYDLSEAVEDFS